MIKTKSNPYIIRSVIKDTKAAFFKELRAGDTLVFHVMLRRGHCAPRVTVYCPELDESITTTFQHLSNRMQCFEIEEVTV